MLNLSLPFLDGSLYCHWVDPCSFLRHDGNELTSFFRQGVAHQSTNDDLYNDYHIPANSIVLPNQW